MLNNGEFYIRNYCIIHNILLYVHLWLDKETMCKFAFLYNQEQKKIHTSCDHDYLYNNRNVFQLSS